MKVFSIATNMQLINIIEFSEFVFDVFRILGGTYACHTLINLKDEQLLAEIRSITLLITEEVDEYCDPNRISRCVYSIHL